MRVGSRRAGSTVCMGSVIGTHVVLLDGRVPCTRETGAAAALAAQGTTSFAWTTAFAAAPVENTGHTYHR